MQSYRLSPNGELTVTPTLSAEELTALMAAVHLSVLRGLPDFTEPLQQSTAKLLSRSSCDVRHAVSRLINSCAVRTPADRYSPATILVVHRVLQAISHRRKLQLTLAESQQQEVLQTRFSPYHVVADSTAWEVTGWTTHHRGVKTFDPCQIRTAEITDEIYAIPRSFRAQH